MTPIHQILEIVETTLYDQQPIPPGASIDNPILFFDKPWAYEQREGKPSRWVSPYMRTNVFDQPLHKNGQQFIIARLNALFLADEIPLQLWQTPLYARTAIQLRINQQSFWDGPAWMCASPFALFDTPRTKIPMLREEFGIEWYKVGASFAKDLDGNWPSNLLIATTESFDVRATVECNDRPDIVLAIHLDGPFLRPAV